jgi:lysozyme
VKTDRPAAATSDTSPAPDLRAARRPRPWIGGGIAVVALVAALLTWFAWLPNHRLPLQAGERLGVDVSHHQGRIDWSRAAADGVSFAYIKATEGGDFTDPLFRENWKGAAEAGVARGAYHFFTLCTPARLQAEHFLRTLPPDPEMLPPAVDLETAGNCSARPDSESVERGLTEFVAMVESATGMPAVLYVNHRLADRLAADDVLPNAARWTRSLFLRPNEARWAMWQVSGMARIDGIDAPVDLDVMSAATARSWHVGGR